MTQQFAIGTGPGQGETVDLAFSPRPAQARVLNFEDLPQALAIARLDPVASALVLTQLEDSATAGKLTGLLWGFPQTGPLTAICWAGGNLIPVLSEPNDWAIAAFAAMAKSRQRKVSSIVGPAHDVLALWEHLRGSWPQPREIRANQPSMVIMQPAQIQADPLVRFGTSRDYAAVFPASVAMFESEVGVSPLRFGSTMYAERVHYLLRMNRTLVRVTEARGLKELSGSATEVMFKADFGVVTREVAQVQGVWIPPRFRGKGLASAAMAAVVNQGLEHTAPIISLYVNDYNAPALATYNRVGFTRVGTFASILF